jgi:hypothetical protein
VAVNIEEPEYLSTLAPQDWWTEVLLIAAKRSDRVAEAACDIVLIRVSRFEKRNHGVGLGSTIFNGIVGKDDAMDENYSLFFLGLYTNAIVYKNSTGSWSRAGKKLLLRWRRAHSFLACPILNQIEKRTGLGPHPAKGKSSQWQLPGMCQQRSRAPSVEEM